MSRFDPNYWTRRDERMTRPGTGHPIGDRLALLRMAFALPLR